MSLNGDRPLGAYFHQSMRVLHVSNLIRDSSRPGPLLVGDTIATGTTLAGILSVAVAEMEAHGNVRDVVCLTVAGSSFCAQHPRLLELDERLARHGRHLVMVFANAQVWAAPRGDVNLASNTDFAE